MVFLRIKNNSKLVGNERNKSENFLLIRIVPVGTGRTHVADRSNA